MKQSEDRRNENQGCNGCAKQPADHGASERRILLAAVAEAERHRHHADNHRKRGHHHRAETRHARFDRGRTESP